MSHPKIAGYTLIVTIIAVTCMTALISAETTNYTTPRMLFIGDGESESWDRVEAGALTAAHDFGVSVLFETPAPGTSPIDQQTAVVRKINLADYGGVGFALPIPHRRSSSSTRWLSKRIWSQSGRTP